MTRAIFLLFDSLNKLALESYGGSVPTPNFNRLASKSVVFDNHFIGSMPCMPARRDLHTGRLNFLHRSWGPLEPFDDSFVVKLKENGVYGHLVTDHWHYWEDGGSTYHNRYNTYEFIRGQEYDLWEPMVSPPLKEFQLQYHENQFGGDKGKTRTQNMINETRLKTDKDFPISQCFDAALSFLDKNREEEDWFLQLECFDPHEPFTSPKRFREGLDTNYKGPTYSWPQYKKSNEDSDEEIAEVRANYMALIKFCDEQLGRLLDYLDKYNMWDEVSLIMTTDHGFLLNEHDWWGKIRMPNYNEIAGIPLMIHDPNSPHLYGQRIDALTQATDIASTILDIFSIDPCQNALGQSLLPLMQGKVDRVRDIALYGVFGGAINCTDGNYTFFIYPNDKPLFEYTLMPMHSRSMFALNELEGAELHSGFNFTKGVPVLKLEARDDARRPPMQGGGFADTNSILYDLKKDPRQLEGFRDPAIEAKLLSLILTELKRQDAPDELYERFNLT